jgi:hypothetical protein
VTGFVALCVIGFVIVVLANVVKSNAGFDRLVANGIPARGILLSVSSTGMKTGTAWRRFESRQVVIDVEIPGQAPYEVATTTIFPINLSRDVLPGATVELRVDRRNPNNVAIIGPGTGFVPAALRTS